jgi:hypothetical protein
MWPPTRRFALKKPGQTTGLCLSRETDQYFATGAGADEPK